MHRWGGLLLAVAVVCVYAPSLTGGFVQYDDPWLIENNPLLRTGTLETVVGFFSDFSPETRQILGAEYLPLRDLSHFLEVQLFGVVPQLMRGVQLALYLGAVLLFRSALIRCLGVGTLPEVAAWAFALHPAHAESVAWLAGRKDVLALLFVAGALHSYAGNGRMKRAFVPLLFLAAAMSKSMAVTAPALLAASDLVSRRRPDWATWAGSALAVTVAFLLHHQVGEMMGMTQQPLGGSRATAMMTMGPILLRYLVLLVSPFHLSVVHDVSVLTSWNVVASLGWLVLVGTAATGLFLWLKRERGTVLGVWLWATAPLLPVSQVIFPLENAIADRYLFLSSMAPALVLGFVAVKSERLGKPISIGIVAFWALFSCLRGVTFADSSRLFTDAMAKTEVSPIPPYQLGVLMEDAGDWLRAKEYYREALRREPKPTEAGRRATNNLARLLVKRKNLSEAEEVLSAGTEKWPAAPKITGNLVEVYVRQGNRGAAQKLCEERLGNFQPGSRAHQRCQLYFPARE